MIYDKVNKTIQLPVRKDFATKSNTASPERHQNEKVAIKQLNTL